MLQQRLKHVMLAAAASLSLFAGGQAAQAVAPANALITNTASMTYTGLATPITASVDVSVTLKAAPPTLAGGPGLNSVVPVDNTVAEGQLSTAIYTLMANANGPDQYNLSSAVTPTNITGAIAVTYTQAGALVTSITLGATANTTPAAIGATSITVPADGIADGNLNGIINGDTVVIGANTYVVNVTDKALGTSTITLIAGTLPDATAAPTTLVAAVPVGTLIAEIQQFNMNIANVGAQTTVAAAFIDVVTTATSNTTPTISIPDTHRTNVVRVTFEKFVRNVTNANGTGAATVINALNYYPTAGAVAATSGDVLEYAIRLTGPVGVAIAGASFSDALPTFTTYVGNSTRLNGITVVSDSPTVSPLIAGLAVDDNVPIRAAGTAATGNIAAAGIAVVTFQVTVN